MIRLFLLALVSVLVWWISLRVLRPTELVLQQNGFYEVNAAGLGAKNVAFALELKTRMPGVVFLFGGARKTATPEQFAWLSMSIDEVSGCASVVRRAFSADNVFALNTITSPRVVMDGHWHAVQFGLDGATATLVVDDVPVTADWPNVLFNTIGEVALLGGSMDTFDGNLYSGCLRNITLGNVRPSAFNFVESKRTAKLGVSAVGACC